MTSETAVVGPIERWVEAHSSGERSVYVDQLQMCVASVDECGCDVMTFAREADARQQLLVDALRPFAGLLPHVERQVRDHNADPIWATGEITITQGHVRAAVEALKSVEGAA